MDNKTIFRLFILLMVTILFLLTYVTKEKFINKNN